MTSPLHFLLTPDKASSRILKRKIVEQSSLLNATVGTWLELVREKLKSNMLFKHIPRLLKFAGPMILSTSAITFMQIIDAIILSQYSSESVTAIGPSGMAVFLFQGFLFGTAAYSGAFVAHSHGRSDIYMLQTLHGVILRPGA